MERKPLINLGNAIRYSKVGQGDVAAKCAGLGRSKLNEFITGSAIPTNEQEAAIIAALTDLGIPCPDDLFEVA